MYRKLILIAVLLSASVVAGVGCGHKRQCCRTDTFAPPPPPVPALYTPPCTDCP